MNEVIVREPSHEEFLKVAQISFENFVNETAKSTGESPLVLTEKLGGSPTKIWDDDIWLLIEKNKRQIGFIWVQLKPEEKSSFGYDIYLDPEFRSQGIGRQVMNLCGQRLKTLGIDLIEIFVFEHNAIARNLYDSLGFKTKKFDEERRQFTLSLSLKELSIKCRHPRAF